MFSPQIDCQSVSVRSGDLRDDTGKPVFSESLALENTPFYDETSKDTAVAGPSPVSKRMRFQTVSLLGRWLICVPHIFR